jgi:hypothetical protein
MRNKVIIGIAAAVVVFLLGFVPQYLKARRVDGELQSARQQNAAEQLRDIIGLVYFQASQKNYGLAGETASRFFTRAREVASRMPDATGRKALENLSAPRDKITAALAKGDPGVMNDLQALFLSTRQATASLVGP